MAIFIGTMGTIALFSMSDIIVSQLNEDINQEELSMLDFFVTIQAGAETDDEAYLEHLRGVTGVTDVIGAVNAFTQFKLAEDDEEFTDGFINGYSVPLEDGLPIEPMRLLGDGRYPEAGANELVIEQRMAEEYALEVGDSVFLRILSPSRDESLDGAVGSAEAWTITGIVFHPYIGAGGGFTGSPTQSMYATLNDAKYIAGTTGLTTFRIRSSEYSGGEAADRDPNYPSALAQSEAISTYIAQETPYIPAFTAELDPEQNALIVSAQTIGLLMGSLALVALIVSGFLVINVITSLILEQRRLIGVMKSMGASRIDNFFMYCGTSFVYGLIGVIPGVIIGVLGGHFASQGLAPLLNTVLEGFGISPFSIGLGVVVGLLVPVIFSILPVFLGTRVSILEAMTDLGIDVNYGSGPIARFIGILPIPITIRQGLSNVSIKKTRLIFTVLTLSVAVGAFMGIFAVFTSLTNGIDIFLDSFNVEIGVFPNETQDPDEMIALITENFQQEGQETFASIEPGFQLQVEFEGYEPTVSVGGPPGIFAYGYDVESDTPAFSVVVDEGDYLTVENRENGIIFSSLLAANMDVGVGDTVTLKASGSTADLQVVGVSEYPIEQVWIDWRTLALVAGYTQGAPTPNQYLTSVEVDGAQVNILGMDTQLAEFIPIEDGEFFTPGEAGIIVSTALAEANEYEVDDTLMLTATSDTGSEGEFPIVGIFDLPPQAEEQGIPAEAIAIFWQDLAALEGISLQGKPIPSGYLLVTNLENPSVSEVDEVMEDLDEVFLSEGIAVTNFNFVELVEMISEGFILFQVILQAVALLIALVGALGLLTTLSMSVFERQKEIGVMRSIGAGSGTIATQFLTEGILVGLISWLVGLPLALGIEYGLLTITGFGDTFPMVYPIAAAVIGLVGMLVITTVASLWPSLAATRKTVSDILRYQ
jgi:ABC-type antimicrobial peptide transport system permease subunit